MTQSEPNLEPGPQVCTSLGCLPPSFCSWIVSSNSAGGASSCFYGTCSDGGGEDSGNARRDPTVLGGVVGPSLKKTEPKSIALPCSLLPLQQRSGGHLLPAIHSGGEFRSFLHGVQQLRRRPTFFSDQSYRKRNRPALFSPSSSMIFRGPLLDRPSQIRSIRFLPITTISSDTSLL